MVTSLDDICYLVGAKSYVFRNDVFNSRSLSLFCWSYGM
jgi:hypothetical protein